MFAQILPLPSFVLTPSNFIYVVEEVVEDLWASYWGKR